MWEAASTLCWTLVCGLAAAGATMIVWAIVGDIFGRLDWLARKPLSCDLCCSTHASWMICLYLGFTSHVAWIDAPIVLLASICVSVMILKVRGLMLAGVR